MFGVFILEFELELVLEVFAIVDFLLLHVYNKLAVAPIDLPHSTNFLN